MKQLLLTFFIGSCIYLFGTIHPAYAHQPRIVQDGITEIKNPEVSQAFYGELNGKPVQFHILSQQPFSLYAGLLVPDIPDIKKNISAEIVQIQNGTQTRLALLDGMTSPWKPYFEEFGRDTYFWGPEYKTQPVPAGEYIITVFNPGNSGKYTLVTGFLEEFPIPEIINASIIVPRLKAQYFNNSFTTLLLSPYVVGYIAVMYALACIAGYLYRRTSQRVFSPSTKGIAKRNIGTYDRLWRAAIGLALGALAIATTWSPILFFFSGFALYEALSSWCVMYQVLGKNTCPV